VSPGVVADSSTRYPDVEHWRAVHPDLICVGDITLDVSVESSALAQGGDVHGRVRIRPGGSSANAATWAAAAGARVRLHGRVGDDLTGRLVSEALRERGVEPALVADPNAPTGTMLVVHEAGDRSMVADRGANEALSPDDLPPQLEAGAVLVSGYILFHQGSEPAGLAALERADAGHVAVDAGSWPLVARYGLERFFAATERATLLFANEREAETLAGVAGADAAGVLAERFPAVCLKLGPRGALVAAGERVIQREGVPVQEVDPTGAGDAFDGAFLAALLRGADLEEALDAGCRAGATAAAGPDPWPPRRQEVPA
jgi:sugar/nucleoside kinase (ribokinase family)